MIEFEQEETRKNGSPVVSIKVVGVGGAGGNTVNSIIDSGHHGIECLAVNTDAQALGISKANTKIQLGVKSTKGMGTGANPELGKRAAEEDLDKVMDVLDGSDIVFLAGGMGGGTGSGALPVIARALKEQNILSIAVVTKPFEFEGKKRARVAEDAISLLKKEVDTLLVIPNQKLLEVTDKTISMIDAFDLINNVLCQSVKGISEIITYPGHINVDFADVRAIMKDMGMAVMGSGTARGEDRAAEAALEAISSPLLENMCIQGARGVLLNITGGKNLGLHEISEAASIIYEQAEDDASIILGSVIDESMDEEVTVTIIATGFTQKSVEDTASEVKVTATVVAPQETTLESAQEEKVHQEKEQITEFEKKETEPEVVQPEEKKEIQESSVMELPTIEIKTKHTGGLPDDLSGDLSDEALAKAEKLVDSVKPETQLINLDDLDVPTFLRKSAKEQVQSK